MKLGSCNLLGTFPNKVLQLQNLQILDLALNKNLSGSLPDFPVNGSLQSLMLSHTNFSGGIPESIGNLKNLSRIELFVGNFSGPIPKSIQNLTQLGYIDLSSNNFTGQIPSFQMCKNLTHVDLSRNSLSVEGKYRAQLGSSKHCMFSTYHVMRSQAPSHHLWEI
uniref:Putative leucine-rich repeat domain, L domain-like protein n=1 Tax=Helianthus annuus TaxID=4232 RepID=A0A251TI56_HELAN